MARRGRPPKVRASDISERTTVTEGLDRTTDETFIVESVRFFIEEATNADAYQQLRKDHIEGWLFYDGYQWVDTVSMRPENEGEALLLNRDIVRSSIKQINPLLTDARPERFVKADNPNRMWDAMKLRQQMGLLPPDTPDVLTDADIAHRLTDIWHAEESRRMEEAELGLCLMEMQISGIEWRMPYWNRRTGQLRVVNLGPLNVLIDPNSKAPDLSDAQYVLIRRMFPADVFQRRHGLSKAKMADILTTQLRGGVNESSLYADYQGVLSYRDYLEQQGRTSGSGSAGRRLYRPMIEEWTCWFWGMLPSELEEEGPSDAIENLYGRVFVVAGDKVVRAPESNPYRHGLFPAIPFRNNPDPTTPYGKGDIRWLKHDQMAVNILISSMLLNALMMGQSRIVTEEGTMKGQWTNDPNQVWETNQGKFDKWRQVEGMNIPPSMMNLMQIIIADSQGQSGVNEAVSGIAPGAQSSGVAIQNLQNAALARVRDMARGMEWSYERQGVLEVALLQQFSPMTEGVRRGEFDMGEWERWHPRASTLTYDILVQSRAKYPMNVLDKLKLALQLAQMGVYDPLEVLEFAELPLSERLKEHLLMAQQIERRQAEMVLGQLSQPQAPMGGGMPPMPGMPPGQGGGMPGGMEMPGTSEMVAVGIPAQGGAVQASQPPM